MKLVLSAPSEGTSQNVNKPPFVASMTFKDLDEQAEAADPSI